MKRIPVCALRLAASVLWAILLVSAACTSSPSTCEAGTIQPAPHWDLVMRGLENGPLIDFGQVPNPRKSAMSRIEGVAVYQHLARGIGVPFERAFHNSPDEGTDEHERCYEVEWKAGATVVRSAGKDGIFGTEDDLRVTWIETGDAALRVGGPSR